MSRASWVVVVIRAWTEHGRLRVRLLRSDPAGSTEVAVTDSPAEAGRHVQRWLDQLLQSGESDDDDEADGPQTNG